ncbi:MAG TPA: hypothetical protein VLM40_06010, partial [Gemmata sp.]|nr:hypothetical protein [Gemmata sp.]
KTWKSLQLNLPTVPVHDLVVKGDDLVLGTHGRSIWILDDLTPVRETTAAIAKKPAHLFPILPTTRWRVSWGGPTSGYLHHAAGDNPANGAAIWYQLDKEFKGEAKLEILDAKGSLVAKASGKFEANPEHKEGGDEKKDDDDAPPKRKLEPKPGLNRFVWDLTHDGATVIPGAAVDSGGAGARVPAAPGTYTVKLIVGKQTFAEKVDVKPDPRSEAALEAQFHARVLATMPRGGGYSGPDPNGLAKVFEEARKKAYADAAARGDSPLAGLKDQEHLSLRVRDDISKLSDTVLRLRAIKKQIGLRKELLKDRKDAKGLLKESEALDKKLDGIEAKLHNAKAKIPYDIFAARGGAMLYSQFAWLLANLVEADGAPTKAQQELAADLEKQLAVLLKQFDGVAKSDVDKLNAAAKKLGVPELYVPPEKKKEETTSPAEK